MYRSTLLAIFLALAACAEQPVAPERVSGIKTIGVVSALGDTVTMRAIGLTVFGNDARSVSTTPAAIDRFVADRLVAELGKRYEVKALTVDATPFAPSQAFFPGDGSLIGESRRPIEENARRLLSASGLDAYVLVSPGNSQYAGTNQRLAGLGVLKTGALFGTHYTLYTLYRVTVFDGRDFKIIGDVRPSAPIPYREVDESWWLASTQTLSDAQRARLETGLDDVIGQSLPATLRSLKLVE